MKYLSLGSHRNIAGKHEQPGWERKGTVPLCIARRASIEETSVEDEKQPPRLKPATNAAQELDCSTCILDASLI